MLVKTKLNILYIYYKKFVVKNYNKPQKLLKLASRQLIQLSLSEI